MSDHFVNPDSGTVATQVQGEPRAFHAKLPDYQPSRLVAAPDLAKGLGVAEVWVKDESARMGLPSFKVLGASWATYRALEERAGGFEPWQDVAELAAQVRERTEVRRLAAATDGNHGRAVARMASWLGMASDIFVPEGTVAARIAAIEGEGALVTVVPGSYEAAVERSAEEADADCLVISDTSWEGYRDVPSWVIDGYSTIFTEAAEQFAAAGSSRADVVAVQIGVGALAAAVVRHHRAEGAPATAILGVEPTSAACALASIRAGEVAKVPGPHESIMAGLNCDSPSIVAWPDVSRGIDAFIAVDDDAARAAMRELAGAEVVSGETGAAGLAGLTAAAAVPEIVGALGLSADSRVLLISTEGATDPEAYESIVGSAPARSTEAQGG